MLRHAEPPENNVKTSNSTPLRPLFKCLSVCIFVVYVSVCVYICCLCICLYVCCLCVCMYVCCLCVWLLSVCLSVVRLHASISVSPSFSLFLSSLCMSVCLLSVYLFVVHACITVSLSVCFSLSLSPPLSVTRKHYLVTFAADNKTITKTTHCVEERHLFHSLVSRN